jgi:thiamine biosynthesis lipoprotein
MKQHLSIISLCILLFSAAACQQTAQTLQLSGSTMGTRYHISIIVNKHINTIQLQQDIEQLLDSINQQMSTYIDASEISRFNRFKANTWFMVSEDLLQLVSMATKAYQISAARFDPSIYPLVDLWGFAKHIQLTPPNTAAIQQALHNTGLQHLKIQAHPAALAKDIPQLSLDLSAIAKGYAVDQVSALLLEQGFTDHLVEIGGEIQAQGKNRQQQAWHIAIEHPTNTQSFYSGKPIAGVYLSQQALATSGDYRNFYEYQGKRYAHTLDPVTGQPVNNTLASVTVIHPSSAWADAMATAIMVMGVKQGLAFANKEKLAVFMVTHTHQDGYQIQQNRYFTRFTQKPTLFSTSKRINE